MGGPIYAHQVKEAIRIRFNVRDEQRLDMVVAIVQREIQKQLRDLRPRINWAFNY